MPAVNWDQPSTGLVSDPGAPSLELANDKDGGLVVLSKGMAIRATSKSAEALRAETKKTVTARFSSDAAVAIVASAPESSAILGGTHNKIVPAIVGLASQDPSLPSSTTQLGGVGVAGLSDRLSSIGVLGAALRFRSTGVVGQALLGTGVRGEGGTGPGLVATSKQTNAIEAFAQSANAAGVYARSNAGPGVAASADAFPGVNAESTQAEGVVGLAHVANAAGVRGHNDGNGGIGIAGAAHNGTGVSASAVTGVCIDATTFNADGIHIDTTNGTGLKVKSFTQPAIDAMSGTASALKANSAVQPAVDAIGLSTGVNAATIGGPDPKDLKKGCGVMGTSLGHAGVCGLSVTGSGVLGIAPPQFGSAGRFRGNVLVEGILFKYASLFSIDHPLEPKRKLLQHAAVEAPEFKTFYDGIATLDKNGSARIQLPRWFDSLNESVRYQLTPIGGPAPNLHVSSEVRKGSFSIAGGTSGLRVSWQLTGVRCDEWARKNPLEVERAKPASRREAAVSKQAMAQLENELRRRAADVQKLTKASPKKKTPSNRTIRRGSVGSRTVVDASPANAKTMFEAVEKLRS